MINKDTQVMSRVLDNPIVGRLFKLLTAVTIPAIFLLIGWIYTMKLTDANNQWSAIKNNADDVTELKIRMGVLEGLSGVKVVQQCDRVHSASVDPDDGSGSSDEDLREDEGENRLIDIKDAWKRIQEERRKRKDEDVEEWKMMEQRSAK